MPQQGHSENQVPNWYEGKEKKTKARKVSVTQENIYVTRRERKKCCPRKTLLLSMKPKETGKTSEKTIAD